MRLLRVRLLLLRAQLQGEHARRGPRVLAAVARRQRQPHPPRRAAPRHVQGGVARHPGWAAMQRRALKAQAAEAQAQATDVDGAASERPMLPNVTTAVRVCRPGIARARASRAVKIAWLGEPEKLPPPQGRAHQSSRTCATRTDHRNHDRRHGSEDRADPQHGESHGASQKNAERVSLSEIRRPLRTRSASSRRTSAPAS